MTTDRTTTLRVYKAGWLLWINARNNRVVRVKSDGGGATVLCERPVSGGEPGLLREFLLHRRDILRDASASERQAFRESLEPLWRPAVVP